tara:strand:+ start:3458 stop:3745 length:288 start_codon:yes stop_codon:yes gene_type:complete
MSFVSFLPNKNFYYNDKWGNTYKFRITKMTKCYITIHQISSKDGDIKNNQRIKIRKEKESDYVKFKFVWEDKKRWKDGTNYLEMSSDNVNYTDEI